MNNVWFCNALYVRFEQPAFVKHFDCDLSLLADFYKLNRFTRYNAANERTRHHDDMMSVFVKIALTADLPLLKIESENRLVDAKSCKSRLKDVALNLGIFRTLADIIVAMPIVMAC